MRPPNYSGALLFIAVAIMLGGLLYVRRNNLQFLYNKQMWAVISLMICFAMVSGQMWNQIRGPPFLHRTKNGPVFINGSSHAQFWLESYIIAVLSILFIVGNCTSSSTYLMKYNPFSRYFKRLFNRL